MISWKKLIKFIKKWCTAILLLVVLLLAFSSIVALISASQWGLDLTLFPGLVRLQALWFIIGAGVFLFTYLGLEFDLIVEISPVIALVVIGLLVWTRLAGVAVYGSYRWISVGPITFQPSELAKISTLLLVAYGYRYRDQLPKVLISSVFVLLQLMLIVIQPDLGTTLLILSGVFVSIFFLGIPIIVFVGIVSVFAIVLPIVWNHLKDYQKLRIIYFLNPAIDPHGHGYNILQALISVGAGGLSGMGIYNATQAKYGFLPVATADFLFASYAQAVGFAGVAALLLLYFILFFCIWLHGTMVNELDRKAFIYGVLWIWFFTFWINIGMNVGVMPITGVPLPFFSYGGTQTVVSFIMLALVLGASKEKIVVDSIEKLRFGEKNDR